MITPKEYATQIQNTIATLRRDWQSITHLTDNIYQSYSENKEWDALEIFFESVVLEVGNTALLETINRTMGDLSEFRHTLKININAALARAKIREDIKAIYFEYFYDGGDASVGDFFLCSRYSLDEDSDWAAYFKNEDIIDGPNIQGRLDFERAGEELPDDYMSVAHTLAHARFLASFGRLVDSIEDQPLPIGFAEHDGKIIHFPPK